MEEQSPGSTRYPSRLLSSIIRLWNAQETLRFRNVRRSHLQYFLAFPLAMIFANIQEVLFKSGYSLFGLDAVTLSSGSYCLGGGILFVFSNKKNISAISKLSAAIAAAGLLMWLLLPDSTVSLGFAMLFMAGIGGCAVSGGYSYAFALNNTERFLGAVLISLFYGLSKINVGFSLLSPMGLRIFMILLVAGIAISLAAYRTKDFEHVQNSREKGLCPAVWLMMYFFITMYFIEMFFTYMPGAAEPSVMILSGVLGVLAVLLCVVLQMFFSRSVWMMCNLFFIAMVGSYALMYAPSGSALYAIAVSLYGLQLIGSGDSPVYISGKTDENGFVNEGTINIVADEGIIYIGGGRWGYLISNAAGYRYGDFSKPPLYLRENSVENPNLDQLKEFNASDVLLDEGEILLRFYANGENVTNMPDPYYRKKAVDMDFTISEELSPSRGGYTFTGWNRNADGSGVTYLPGAVYRSNVGLNLYAQWTASATSLEPQNAPTGVGKTNASTWGGNGALTGTTAAMQYRTADDAYTWYWCAASSTPVLTGKYWVRYAPKEGYGASPEVYVGKVLEPAATPVNSDFTVTHLTAIGANNGEIRQNKTGVAYEYRIAGAGNYQDIVLGIIQDLSVTSVEIRVKEISGVSLASLPLTLYVKQPAAAPFADLFTVTHVTTYGGHDGLIFGVNNTMRYQFPPSSIWRPIPGTSISNLTAGDYKIRYAETSTALTSDYVTLTVKQPAQNAQAPSGLTAIHATVYGGNGAITGTDVTMEYSSNGTIWTTCSAPSTAVPAGVYSVRYKETTYTPSPTVQITITQPAEVYTITFVTQPAASTEVTAGSISGSLSATATVTPGGTATLNWYACSSGGTISGSSLGTGGTFAIPSALTAGNYYYRCQATFMGATTIDSNVATVTVNARTATRLATPTSLAWSSGTSSGTATWSAVLNASSYSVQLYKGGTTDANKVGSMASSTTASYNFASAIAASGAETYYFKVMAVGDGTNYSNSAWSGASGAYSYAAPADPPASANSISGITAEQTYMLGDTVTFTAHGGGMTNTSPTTGDKRWLPTAWATNPSGNFGSGYTQSFSTTGMTLDAHTLTVTFNQQQYSGTAWVNTGTTDAKSVAFTVGTGTPPEPSVPTIISPTQDQAITVVVGNTATMTITATNATGYQWYIDRNDGRGFVAISGAISASYTTSPVAMENDGYRYYCAVPNGTPTATSPIFTLNVIKQPEIPATGDKPELRTEVLLLAGAGLAVSVVLRHRKRA